MSQALPGTHLCKEHQGNHSHYAPENCELCQAQAEIELLREENARLRALVEFEPDLEDALAAKEENRE
jgi:hypothetical protein